MSQVPRRIVLVLACLAVLVTLRLMIRYWRWAIPGDISFETYLLLLLGR